MGPVLSDDSTHFTFRESSQAKGGETDMSNFNYRPSKAVFNTWSQLERERLKQAKQEGRISKLTLVRCEICIRQLTEKVVAYSKKHFTKTLCYRCQETERLLSEKVA